MAGTLAPGAQLPSTAQLAEEFAVATTTVQNAVQLLKNEGFVTSRTGAGVYVRDRQQFVVNAAAYFEPATRGVTYKLLSVEEVTAPPEVAEALGESAAVLRHRMTLRGTEPVELSWSYYPASLAAGTPLAGRGKIPGGAPRVLAEAGYPEREFVDRLSTRPPTTEEAEQLVVPPGIPVLRQFRIVYSDDRRPVEVSLITKPGHLYELSYTTAIPSSD
jgi:GntR family transcriptional regulator